MRVISGTAKGRRLKSPKSPDTRPIMDRVKTALFDILSRDVRDAHVLDLFAGTGSVGIEALSRGAAAVTFVELSPEALKLVRENLRLTGLAARAETIRADAFHFLETAYASGRRFSIVYLAPPQYQHLAARAIAELDRLPLTKTGDLVIAQLHPVERAELDALPLRRLRFFDARRYGSTLLMFYEHDEAPQEGSAPFADDMVGGSGTSEREAREVAPREVAPREVAPSAAPRDGERIEDDHGNR
jgi:16S rRNA (guanine966-N2)-methyltransferase